MGEVEVEMKSFGNEEYGNKDGFDNDDNYEIYMLTNEDTYGRCPVLGGKNQPLQAVWEAQKSRFRDGTRVTVSTLDGRKETFTK